MGSHGAGSDQPSGDNEERNQAEARRRSIITGAGVSPATVRRSPRASPAVPMEAIARSVTRKQEGKFSTPVARIRSCQSSANPRSWAATARMAVEGLYPGSCSAIVRVYLRFSRSRQRYRKDANGRKLEI